MLFSGCNCISDASTLGALCAGGSGFVTAMMAALAAGARTAEAQPLGRSIPEVDRVAVRIVTDNIVIQFVPNEKRGDLTIERRTGGNTRPDAPPYAALNGEWGLVDARRVAARRRDAERADRFRLHRRNAQQQHVDPQARPVAVRCDRAEPRPLRPFRRHGRLPQGQQGQAEGQAAVLCRRRRRVLPAQESRRQFRRARPQGDHGMPSSR